MSLLARRSPPELAQDVSWGVVPLVAGLFVLVQALPQTGVIAATVGMLEHDPPGRLAAVAGIVLAFTSNLVNNMPAGLVASEAVVQTHPPRLVMDGLLVGVDLGPALTSKRLVFSQVRVASRYHPEPSRPASLSRMGPKRVAPSSETTASVVSRGG